MYRLDLLAYWYLLIRQIDHPISQVMYWHSLSVYDEVMTDIRQAREVESLYSYGIVKEGD
jgi:hypothetical protein